MADQMPLPLETDCLALQTRLKSGEPITLLDCRERDEFATCRISGARLLPMGEIPERIDELTPLRESTVIVYCHHGVRSLRTARWLRERGFENVQSLSGGIDAWSREIDPTVPRY